MIYRRTDITIDGEPTPYYTLNTDRRWFLYRHDESKLMDPFIGAYSGFEFAAAMVVRLEGVSAHRAAWRRVAKPAGGVAEVRDIDSQGAVR